MATKTISIDIEAYNTLVRARSSPDESFSKVIKRGAWKPKPKTAAALLAALESAEPLSDESLEYLERIQREDKPPANKWKKRSA
jgi:predicted CopG family antitoxin